MNNDDFNFQRIKLAIQFISEHVKEQPSLEVIAEKVHLSSYHFQRIFTQWVGISPKKFMQFLTTNYLKGKLNETANLIEAAELSGLSAQSRVYDLFINIEAVTPQEFKSYGKGLEIIYGSHLSPFGVCFIAVTQRGICALSFIESNQIEEEILNLKKQWSFATFKHDLEITAPYLNRIFKPNIGMPNKFHLLVQGSKFQIKVWEALLKIPEGALSTYKTIAENIGVPKASRAVGTAIGRNPIAYLIPCHRVIKSTGELGEYRWGNSCKKAIIGWEASKLS